MGNFTEKQKNFINLKIQGVKNLQAARLAGYAVSGAAVQATRLMKMPEVIAAIEAGQKAQGIDPKVVKSKSGTVEDDGTPRLRDNYENPMEFFTDVMNNPRMAEGMRFEAAKQLLPYQHAKLGDIGKKEGKVEAAKQVATGHLAPQAPPPRQPRLQ